MLIHVKIEPEAREDEVMAKSDNNFIVKVRAKAERNEANKSMKELLAKHFKVDEGAVRIITGHHTRSKIVDIK